MLQALGAWFAWANMYVLVGAFLSLAVLEVLRPKRALRLGLDVRWTTNLGLQAVNTVVFDLLVPLTSLTLVAELWSSSWQPVAYVSAYVGAWPVLLIGLLALDASSYALHRIEHAVLPLWWLHTVHHSDTEVDASTGFRHHPIEYLVSFVAGLLVVALLGLPPWVVSLYAVLAVIAGVAQHANLTLPARIDAWLRYFVVTPAMHEVHHSADQRDHDTNYGTVFSFWDRLFGTYRDGPALGTDHVRFGIEPFTAPAYAAPHWVCCCR